MEGITLRGICVLVFQPQAYLVSNGVGDLNWLRNVLNLLGADIFINGGIRF